MASNLLIVDDVLTVTQASRNLLEQTGTTSDDILTAHTATEAMQLFREHHPGTILLDVGLPDMGGHELAKDLEEVDPEARIVVLTALSRQDSRVQSIVEERGHPLIQKPIEPEDLALLDGSESRSQP